MTSPHLAALALSMIVFLLARLAAWRARGPITRPRHRPWRSCRA